MKSNPHEHPGEGPHFNVVRRWNPERSTVEWWCYGEGWTISKVQRTWMELSSEPVVAYDDTWCEPRDGWNVAP